MNLSSFFTSGWSPVPNRQVALLGLKETQDAYRCDWLWVLGS